MVRHLQMKELVGDDEILKGFALLIQINRQRDRAGAGARAPFAGHMLHPNDVWHDPQLDGPMVHAPLEAGGISAARRSRLTGACGEFRISFAAGTTDSAGPNHRAR